MSNSNNLRYFDYAATTPADARVIEAMVGCLGAGGIFGNPASTSHRAGASAREMVEHARGQVAELVGADPDEIVWTSGATESNNLALKGFFDLSPQPRHLITSRLEHKAILDTAGYLERRGTAVTYVSPDESGAITVDAVRDAVRDDTRMVSLMLVNNEIGTLTDIAAISEVVHEAGALLHVDAAQALGKTSVDVGELGIDLMSMSAHKLYGPKGVGALYISKACRDRIACQIHGGGHEQGLRSGTLATHQIVGMGVACEIARGEMSSDNERIAGLSKHLLDELLSLGVVTLNASGARRIPHTLSLTVDMSNFFSFMLTDDIAISSTSACNSAAGLPSHVLVSLGLGESEANQTVRVSLGRYTTLDDVEVAVACFRNVVGRCHELLTGSPTHNA